MLDTCVYIDVAQGRTSSEVEELLTARISNHSTICLAELTHLFGRLDPSHPEPRGRSTSSDMQSTASHLVA